MGARGPLADDVRNERLHGLPSPAQASRRPGANQVPPRQPGWTPPKAPRGLRIHGKRLWAHAWEANWLRDRDASVLENACRILDEMVELRALIKQHGHLIEEVHASSSGKVLGTRLVANPACKLLRDAEASFTSALNQLGLTPAARARISSIVAEAATAASKLAELQAWRSNRGEVGQ